MSFPYPRLALALGLTLLCAAPAAWAQETTATPPAADGTVEIPPPPLSLGEEAPPEEGAIGSSYTPATFDLWEQRCIKTADGADPCSLYQLLNDSTGNPVAEFNIFGVPPGTQAAAGATIIVPLETLLTRSLTIAIDSNPPKVYPFTFCTPQGCIARVGFTADEVAQFKKGAKADLTIVPAIAPDQKVVLPLSLKGFTAGFEAVEATTPKVAAPAP